MAYQSKYTGLQIDDILDSVEWKQGKIEDLASIRAGAQKGATALQSYTEKYTGTVTGIKINGVVKSGSGVIDLGTVITSHQDISGKQDKLVSGTNIKTINGESILGSGDITISGGITQEQGDKRYVRKITEDDMTVSGIDQIRNPSSGMTYAFAESRNGNEDGIILTSDITKTINGQSLLGVGDLTIEGGAKIYTWSPTITSIEDEDTQISGTFTEEEYYNILNADVLYINVDEESVFCIARGVNSENGEGIRITGSQITTYADFAINIFLIKEDGVFTGTMSEPIPSKTSQLTNDSNFITSVKVDNLSKTPSSGVVDLGYVNKKLTTSTSSSMTLSPNIYYRNTSTSLSTLTITLGSVSNSNIINEYFVEFTTNSSGTTVSLPSTIKWANGEAPTFEASTTYQISIVNNLGVVTKFK